MIWANLGLHALLNDLELVKDLTARLLSASLLSAKLVELSAQLGPTVVARAALAALPDLLLDRRLSLNHKQTVVNQ